MRRQEFRRQGREMRRGGNILIAVGLFIALFSCSFGESRHAFPIFIVPFLFGMCLLFFVRARHRRGWGGHGGNWSGWGDHGHGGHGPQRNNHVEDPEKDWDPVAKESKPEGYNPPSAPVEHEKRTQFPPSDVI